MQNLEGTTFEKRYRMDEKLTGGSMSVVYKAFDLVERQTVVIKILNEELAALPRFVRHFRAEAEKLKQLNHSDIIRIFDFKQKGSLAYISEEYIEGGTLRKKIGDLGEHPMPSADILKIIEPVCNALSKTHRRKIIHCDIKPANIMIRPGGRAVLTDFGIARDAEATATMEAFGTPAYMSPDQIRGEIPTPQMDIYALGVILFELVTGGEQPFTGDKATTKGITGKSSEKIRWEQIYLPPPRPSKFNKDISPQMEKIILKCLAKDPQKRFASTSALLEAIKRSPIYSTEPAPAPETESVSIEETKRERRPKKSQTTKDNTRIVLWGGAALVLVVFVLLVGNSGSGDGTVPIPVSSGQQAGGGQQVAAVQDPTSTPTRKPPTPTRTPTPIPPIYDCNEFEDNPSQYTIELGSTTEKRRPNTQTSTVAGMQSLYSIERIVGSGHDSYYVLRELHAAVACFDGSNNAFAFYERSIDSHSSTQSLLSGNVWASGFKGNDEDKYLVWFVDRNVVVQIKGLRYGSANDSSVSSETIFQATQALQNVRSLLLISP